jgi:PhnB protein
MPGIQPELSVRRGRDAIGFYAAAFGAVEDYRVGGTDEHEPVVDGPSRPAPRSSIR